MLRVLIADDVKSVRERLKSLISVLDNAEVVAEATSASEAIDIAGEEDLQVVILDIEMPGSGIKVLDHIHQHSPHIVIVMLTNHADDFFREVCLRKGASYFLDKSLEFNKVASILDQLSTTAA